MNLSSDEGMIDWLAEGEANVLFAHERYQAFLFAREAARDRYDYRDAPGFEALEALILRRLNDTHNVHVSPGGYAPDGVGAAAQAKVSAKLDQMRSDITRLFDIEYNYLASFEKQPKETFKLLAPGEIGKAIRACQQRIAYYERALSAEQIAIHDLNLSSSGPGEAAYRDWAALQGKLARGHYDAIRDLYAFAGLISDKSDELCRLLKIYYSRSFEEPQAIMHYLDGQGRSPGSYSAASEERFRADLRRRIKAL